MHDVPRESELIQKRAEREWNQLPQERKEEIQEIWDDLSEEEKQRRLDEAEMDLM